MDIGQMDKSGNKAIFKVGRGVVFKTLLLTPSASWQLWTLMAAGAILIIAGMIINIRLLAVGLMICLTIIPTAAFFLFFKTMLSDSVLPNLLPHTIDKSGDDLVLTSYREEHPEDEAEETLFIKSASVVIRKDAIERSTFMDEYRVLWLKNGPLRLLFLPLSEN